MVVPVAASYGSGGKVTSIDQVFLGLFVFLIGATVQVNWELARQRAEHAPDVELWDVRSDADASLSNIRKHFNDILQRRNSLYILYFQRQVRELDQSLFEAATDEDLVVDQDVDTTDMMLRDFSGGDEHVIRFVHYLSENDTLFDVHATQFFSEVARGVTDKRIKGVKRLFVWESNTEVSEDRSQRLLAFHMNAGFECRLIERSKFERIKRDSNLPTDTHDFGIYGKWYVYRSRNAAASSHSGVFSSNQQLVSRFITFFDRYWDSQFTDRPQDVNPVDLKQLFGRAPVSPNRPVSAALNEPAEGSTT